jgi:HEAT repeat protein
MPSTARRSPPVALVAAWLFFAPGCRTSGAESDRSQGEPRPFVPLPDPEPESIGYFLTGFDRSLQEWSMLKMTASSPRERSKLQGLEDNMEERARKRRAELLETLEHGAPLNRRVAAAALGFTGDPTVLGPLLAVLSDPDPELVQKALLAIGVLALPETPLAEIRQHLLHAPDAWTRNNAAFVFLAIARSGNRTADLADGCRAALSDDEPSVRAQCASTLGVVADATAVPLLSDRLFDTENLVALASAAALARIGRQNLEQKGTVARALAGGLEEVGADRRAHLLGALRWLAEEDLGEDAGPWLEWAFKLP